jgi:hypothetical protein
MGNIDNFRGIFLMGEILRFKCLKERIFIEIVFKKLKCLAQKLK